ncbi:hypothetical protein PVAP13_6NG115503 [Panicum virgatum]|uniref:Uncharacterized protein n=1 Tax=Panicum virgatum TaxID=38727 RepID=A0A8T0QZG1_PANVG|nr:hypothetical protein PVAP13_6NG115503 [Panicum virgatum]
MTRTAACTSWGGAAVPAHGGGTEELGRRCRPGPLRWRGGAGAALMAPIAAMAQGAEAVVAVRTSRGGAASPACGGTVEQQGRRGEPGPRPARRSGDGVAGPAGGGCVEEPGWRGGACGGGAGDGRLLFLRT